NAAMIRIGIEALAVAVGLAALVLGLLREEPGYLLPMPVEVAIGWSFVGAGMIGWSRRPGNRTGVLLVLAGFAWFARQIDWLDTAAASHVSHVALNLFLAIVAHLLIVFPAGAPR